MEEQETQTKNWHDKYYKLMLLIPLFLIVVSLIYVGAFYSKHNDVIYKDISLTGGTSVTIYQQIDVFELETELSSKLEDISTREIYDLVTREQKAIIIETKSDSEITKQVLEEYLGYELNEKNSSFMGIVVFIIFRTFIPSAAVILSAFADILMTLALVDVLGIKMSSAGIVAFLMLIGYSVDTDILLTTRILKRREDTLNKRILGAFKTGITMTLTSLLAILLALFVVKSFSVVLTQIFTILAIGLSFDLLNTWITNTSILKWYVKKKHGT